MKKYGSKDIMRIESIRKKSQGDYLNQIMYAYNMSCAITEPGKAMARGYAAQEVFGEYSALAYVFFERAYDLGGVDVKPVASVNTWENTEEGIEAEYEGIPKNELPASRRNKKLFFTQSKFKTPFSRLINLGKINVIKGSGPKFNLYDHSTGTLEIWKAENGTYKIVYTFHYEPIYRIGDKRTFKYDNKTVIWEMIDYIEVENVSNLAPLYGKSIAVFNYN